MILIKYKKGKKIIVLVVYLVIVSSIGRKSSEKVRYASILYPKRPQEKHDFCKDPIDIVIFWVILKHE